MMLGNPCKDCHFYAAPSFWKRFRQGMFAERCLHPKERGAVSGDPIPCVTARINDCDGTPQTLFRSRSRQSESAK